MAKSVRLEVRLDAGLLARLDGARGREPRGSFVRWALEQALSSGGESGLPARKRADPVRVDSSESARSAAASARASEPLGDGKLIPPGSVEETEAAFTPLPKIAGRHWAS